MRVPVALASSADSFVTGHRMAFAISEKRTVLWDQIKFNGSPDEFGWVLPVKPGAYIEKSTDAWFEALDTVTTVHVASPLVTCPSPNGFGRSGSGCGIGCSSAESADSVSLEWRATRECGTLECTTQAGATEATVHPAMQADAP
jgi:hypothetical protein